MKPPQASNWITDPRFAPYLSEAGGDYQRAVALYVWNTRMSVAMFEVVAHTEVLLRNVIDAQFLPVKHADHYAKTWLTSQVLTATSRARVEESAQRIVRQGAAPTRARVAANLSFGFWRALFDSHYHPLWMSHLHKAFPYGTGNRHQVAGLTSRLLPFRNRIAHHETIISRPIKDRYEDLLELARIIDPDAQAWIESVTRVPEMLNERPEGAPEQKRRIPGDLKGKIWISDDFDEPDEELERLFGTRD